MTGQYLTIGAKHRQMPAMHASLADFTVTSGEAVSADIVIRNPNISLYCLDDAAKQAIFVEVPLDVDLAKEVFVYQTQYEQAQRLIAMPYDTFRQVARQLPEVQHLIMIYMTGRCGSTLLSHLFNEVDTVLSLSEPDVATDFVRLRSVDGLQDAELRNLLDCTVRFLFKPTPYKIPSTYALKLRNEGTQLMDLFQETFPQAKNIFLYRDAIGYVTSFYRILKLAQVPDSMPVGAYVGMFRQFANADLTRLTVYLDEGTSEMSIPQFLTLWWLAVMEWYLARHERGIPALAVRYEDLNTHRERTITEVFQYCGLPTSKVQETLGVFEQDAQAGAGLARENPQEGNKRRLSDEQRRDVLSILERHPVVKESGFIVPGTLQV